MAISIVEKVKSLFSSTLSLYGAAYSSSSQTGKGITESFDALLDYQKDLLDEAMNVLENHYEDVQIDKADIVALNNGISSFLAVEQPQNKDDAEKTKDRFQHWFSELTALSANLHGIQPTENENSDGDIPGNVIVSCVRLSCAIESSLSEMPLTYPDETLVKEVATKIIRHSGYYTEQILTKYSDRFTRDDYFGTAGELINATASKLPLFYRNFAKNIVSKECETLAQHFKSWSDIEKHMVSTASKEFEVDSFLRELKPLLDRYCEELSQNINANENSPWGKVVNIAFRLRLFNTLAAQWDDFINPSSGHSIQELGQSPVEDGVEWSDDLYAHAAEVLHSYIGIAFKQQKLNSFLDDIDGLVDQFLVVAKTVQNILFDVVAEPMSSQESASDIEQHQLPAKPLSEPKQIALGFESTDGGLMDRGYGEGYDVDAPPIDSYDDNSPAGHGEISEEDINKANSSVDDIYDHDTFLD